MKKEEFIETYRNRNCTNANTPGSIKSQLIIDKNNKQMIQDLDYLIMSEKVDLIEQVIETLYGRCGLCEKGESCPQCEELREELRGIIRQK